MSAMTTGNTDHTASIETTERPDRLRVYLSGRLFRSSYERGASRVWTETIAESDPAELEVRIDPDHLRALAVRAFHSKGGRAKAGALLVVRRRFGDVSTSEGWRK